VAASVTADYYGGAATEPAGTDATTGIMFNREDSQKGTLTIPIPQVSPNTYYSWYKQVALAITVTDPVTSLGNRSIKLGTNVTLATGVKLYFMSAPAYRQSTTASMPPNATANGATPTDPNGDGTYAAITVAAQVYDGQVVPSANGGRNGNFCRLVFAVDGNYTGGAGQLTLPNIIMGYDES